MKAEFTDVRRTLEYAQSHDLARQALPVTIFGVLLGLFLMTPLDSAVTERRNAVVGGIVIAISLVFLGMVIYRRSQPSVPRIVLSPQGIVFLDVSRKVIPWNEIREIGVARVSETRDLVSTKVIKLVVSQRFYQSLTGGIRLQSTVAAIGDPSEIYLAYNHDVPFEALQREVVCRWRAFSRHAGRPSETREDVAAETREDVAAEWPVDLPPHQVSSAQSPSRGGGVIQRASSFEGTRAFGPLISTSSPGQFLAIVASLAGIAALLGNLAGLWSTDAQVRGRTKAAEWRQWQERHDANRKASDDDQRRTRDMWDRKFKCMDEYWALHERGGYKKDPECMREGK